MTKRVAVDNASSSQQIKRAAQQEKLRERQYLADCAEIINLPSGAGERFFWAWLEHCGVLQTVYAPESNRMYFNAGRRDVGLKLVADMTAAKPSALADILQKAVIQENKDNG